MKVLTEIKILRYTMLACVPVSAFAGLSDMIVAAFLVSWAVFESIGILIEKMDGRD